MRHLMTIILKPEQERAIQEAIKAGLIRSVDEFIETAIKSLPHGGGTSSSRADAVRRMQEFGDTYRLSLGEPITRTLLHEGHRV
jgi:Arc/MetJ-type ribon-helix-helix transcriptional regulator